MSRTKNPREMLEDAVKKPRWFTFGYHFDEHRADHRPDGNFRPEILKPGHERKRVEYPAAWSEPAHEVLLETVGTFEDPRAGRVLLVVEHHGMGR